MNPETLQEKFGELEALLFIHGEPLALKKVGAVLGLKNEELETLLTEFKKNLASGDRGLMLMREGEKIQLATRPQFHKILESFVKEELSEDLTHASLETIASIAYFAPISRNRLEYLRGVNSIFILRSLLLRGLIERFLDPERPNTYLYRPTFDLLKHLGLGSQEDLPDYGKFQSLLKTFESSDENLQNSGNAGAMNADTGPIDSQ